MAVTNAELEARVEAVFPEVVAWRRHVHAHPDVSFHEEPTATFIEAELRKMDVHQKLHITRPLPVCVVADLVGEGGSGPLIALRADIDALPVHEASGETFSSTVDGCMHACGHDTHMAMLMGVVKLALEDVRKIKGTVRFIFQHAEELAPGGAVQMIEKGVMKGVDKIFGLHVIPHLSDDVLRTGTIMIRKGAIFTGNMPLEVVIQGRGGHASMPEKSIDPVPIAALIVSNVQSMVTRRFLAPEAPVVTVTNLNTSTNSYNVIADTVNMKFSIRYRFQYIKDQIKDYMESICQNLCAASGATCTITWGNGYNVTTNDEKAFEITEKVALDVLGEKDIIYGKQSMGPSEDFSAYLAHSPGNYYCIGIYNEEKGCTYNNHHPCFKVDEDAFKVGVKMHYGHIRALLM